jgi:hypothetical protein
MMLILCYYASKSISKNNRNSSGIQYRFRGIFPTSSRLKCFLGEMEKVFSGDKKIDNDNLLKPRKPK